MPDRLSLLDATHFRQDATVSGGQVTDSYLVALAASAGIALATFDRKLVTTAVADEQAEVCHIP